MFVVFGCFFVFGFLRFRVLEFVVAGGSTASPDVNLSGCRSWNFLTSSTRRTGDQMGKVARIWKFTELKNSPTSDGSL